MNKLKKILIIASVSAGCVGCMQQPPKDKPILKNIKNNYNFFIAGKITPNLTGKIKLKWYAKYATYNPKCARASNVYAQFEGGVFPQQSITSKDLTVDKNNSFRVKIPLDKYKPGLCKWNIKEIDYSINNSPRYVIARFDVHKHEARSSAIDVLKCENMNNKIQCLPINKQPPFNRYSLLNTNNNYSYNLKIKS